MKTAIRNKRSIQLSTGINCFIGLRGCGKTTEIENSISELKSDNPSLKIIGCLECEDSVLRSSCDLTINKNGRKFKNISNVTDSLIFIEDFMSVVDVFIGKSTICVLPDGLSEIFEKAQERNNIIIVSLYSVRHVIPELFNNISRYVIFKTGSDAIDSTNKMIKLSQAMKEVNDYCAKIGSIGKHPKDPKYDGRDFPFITLDAKTEQYLSMNF